MIDSINPTAKTIGLLAATILLGLTFKWQVNVVLSVICLVFLVTSKRTDAKKLSMLMVPVFLVSVSYFFTGWLFQSDQTLLGQAAESLASDGDAQWVNGLNLGTRLLAFGMMGLSFSMTTDAHELVASFIQQAKMPMKMGYAILTALNFTKLINQEYKHSKLALQVRNLPVGPFDTKPLFTMMVRMVRWSDHLSLAMESKGFSEERTMKLQMNVSARDVAFMIGLPLLVVALNAVFR